MTDDLETWLLEAGEEVIRKRAERGEKSLSPTENAIYCMWVLDYAVRNSGTFGPMEEMRPTALDELSAFARTSGLGVLTHWLSGARNEAVFCETYYEHFDSACVELKQLNDRT